MRPAVGAGSQSQRCGGISFGSFRHVRTVKACEIKFSRAAKSTAGVEETNGATNVRPGEHNRGEPPAKPGEFEALRIGDLEVWPPVIAAPMAGITNPPYRQLCADQGAPLCMSEMLIAHTLLEGAPEARRIASFYPGEAPRSVQLYGVDDEKLQAAAAMLVQEHGVQHIDLNFGCPVRKVTSKGGGAALTLRPRLLARLVRAAVRGAGGVPVTAKLRVGISQQLPTFLESGRAAVDEGAAALTLHARCVDQLYSPPACWPLVAQLARSLTREVPVIGNGDVFEPGDGLALMRGCGAAGVMVGRGALGRPWLFRQLQDCFCGREPRPDPPLRGALEAAVSHLEGLAGFEREEWAAVRQMRKFIPEYLRGFSSAADLQKRLLTARTVAEWHAALREESYDPQQRPCLSALRHPRLKGGTQPQLHKVALPPGWARLDASADDGPLPGADVACEG